MEDRTKLREEQGRRLMEARLAAGFKSAAKAVKASPTRAKWKASTYKAHERGTRTIGQDDAERYASFFRGHGADVTEIDILFPWVPRQLIEDAKALGNLSHLVKELAEAARVQRQAHPSQGAPPQPVSKAPLRGSKVPKKPNPPKRP